jgi:cytosine deaminase
VNWVLSSARVPNRSDLVDIFMRDGRLRILPTGQVTPEGWLQWDLEGRLVLPGLVELHTHLDKTYTDPFNPEGTLMGAIRRFERVSMERTLADIETNAERALRAAIQQGVTRMRTHLVFGDQVHMATLEVMVGLRRRYAECLDLQLVAMTWDAMSPETQRLLRTGLQQGFDLLGGAPSLSQNPRKSVTDLVDLAIRFEVGLDLHLDEDDSRDSVGLRSLLAHRHLPTGPGKVTASHCCSLAFMPTSERDALLHDAAEKGVGLVVLPGCNLVLQGRGHHPVPRGMAPVAAARAAGMAVAAGVDNVQDAFNPFGDYDPLQSARLAAMVGHLGNEGDLSTALDLVTRDAAILFGGGPALIEDGLVADAVVLDCSDVASAIAEPPARLATFKRGRLVVKTETQRRWLPRVGKGARS